jgi:hypothetical protein
MTLRDRAGISEPVEARVREPARAWLSLTKAPERVGTVDGATRKRRGLTSPTADGAAKGSSFPMIPIPLAPGLACSELNPDPRCPMSSPVQESRA